MAQKCEPTTQRALKLVGEALKLDSENSDEEAYLKYLESISVIASTLYSDQKVNCNDSRHLLAEQKQKLIDVARQCLDRIDVLSKKPAGAKDGIVQQKNRRHTVFSYSASAVPNSRAPSSARAGLELPATVQMKPNLPPPLIAEPDALRARNSESNAACRMSVLESMDWISPEEPTDEACIQRTQEILSPLEKAYQANRSLIATYKKRSAHAPNSYARINLSLELQRRLTENLQVARTQQDVYLREIREKQTRHWDEVTRKVVRGEDVDSAEFQHRRDLCAKTIEYEQHQTWIADSKKQLSENPENLDLVELIVRRILRDSNHPITEELYKKSESLCKKILPLLDRNVVADRRNDFSDETAPTEKAEDCKSVLLEADLVSPISEPDSKDGKANSPEKDTLDDKNADSREPDNAERASEAFEETYAHNARDIEQAIKSGSILMSSLKSTLKKQKQVLKKHPVKSVARSKLKDGDGDPNDVCQMTARRNRRSHKAPDFGALARHLESLAGEARDAVDFLVELFTLTYQQMERDENHERSYLVIEDYFFSRVWPPLMQLCKLAFAADECRVQESMRRLRDCTPVTLGFDASSSNIQPSEEDFDSAVQTLKRMVDLQTPTKKLEDLVLVAKVLCEKHQPLVNEAEAPKLKPIGADDLIPLLGYTCILSDTPQLISECHLLEHLIHPKYLMGEAGYCLTSLQTALQYVQMYETKKTPDDASIETAV